MILAGRMQTGLCLVALCLLAAPVAAEQGWQPVVSRDATPSRDAEGAARDIEQGWFPVMIRLAQDSGPAAAARASAAPAMAEASSKQIPEPQTSQRLGAPQPRAQSQIQSAPQPQIQPQPSLPAQPQAQRTPPKSATPPPAPEKPAEARPEHAGPAQDYCENISDAAADARFAWQKRTLEEMEKELEQRVVILEKKTTEYREWLARRDAFVKKAQASLVGIYALMRPDAAASQLAAMDEETAAAVLTKLNPRNASAILNEMPAGPAARLTAVLVGAARTDPEDGAPPPAQGGKS